MGLDLDHRAASCSAVGPKSVVLLLGGEAGHRGVFLTLSPCVGRTASELWLGMVGAESQGHFRIYSQTEISRPAFGADRCVSFWVPQWEGLLSDGVAKCWSQVMGLLQDLQLDQGQWVYL